MTLNLNYSSPSNFQLVFSKLPFENELDKYFVLNIYNTIIPGISFSPSDEGWQGANMKIIYDSLIFNDWTFNFLVDEYWYNWKKIFKWMNYINNNKDQFVRKKTDYIIDASLIIKNNYGNNVFNIDFKNIFPYNLSDVDETYQDEETYLNANCTFAYDYYELNEN